MSGISNKKSKVLRFELNYAYSIKRAEFVARLADLLHGLQRVSRHLFCDDEIIQLIKKEVGRSPNTQEDDLSCVLWTRRSKLGAPVFFPRLNLISHR